MEANTRRLEQELTKAMEGSGAKAPAGEGSGYEDRGGRAGPCRACAHGVATLPLQPAARIAGPGQRNDYLVYLSEPIEPLGFSAPNLSFSRIAHAPRPGATCACLWPCAPTGWTCISPPPISCPLKVCPAVVVVHDISFRTHPEWFSGELRFRFDSIFWREVRKAERIITVSEFSRQEIARPSTSTPRASW